MKKIIPTAEIIGAIIADTNASELKNDAHSYLTNEMKAEIGNTQVKVVENNNNHVNVTLPYYHGLENGNSAYKAELDEMEAVSGGQHVTNVTNTIYNSLFGAVIGLTLGLTISGLNNFANQVNNKASSISAE